MEQRRALSAARDRFEGSLAQSFVRRLRALDFANEAMLFGAGLLVSLLPFVILLSSFASHRVDDDISLRLGLDRRAAGIVDNLFTSSPASLNVATATSLVFLFAGMIAVASSLQQIYEKVFHQDHRGIRGVYRLLIWIVVLCVAVAFESVVGKAVRNVSAGGWLAPLVTVAIATPFLWWTMHFLLAGRVPWRKLLPSAIVTGVFYGGLGVFSRFYFSDAIISDSKTYGTIGAVFSIMTWLIAIGAVVILGAVAGVTWEDRRNLPGRTAQSGGAMRHDGRMPHPLHAAEPGAGGLNRNPWAGSPLGRSGYFPAPVAEPRDHVDASAERGDVGAHDVDAGDLPMFDLGDAGLGYSEGLG
jgi:membrane protein